MDLVETYLAAVDAQLPLAMRADVIAELRDTLLSKLEEKRAALGRAPNPSETAAVLKAFGHPLVVANRYRKHQLLIGPEVYPFYVVTLQWVLGIVTFLHIVLAAVGASSARNVPVVLARFWSEALPGLLGAFAIVTIVFLVIERAGGGPGLARSWSPRTLGPSMHAGPTKVWETLFEMAFETVFLLAWVGVIRFELPAAAADAAPVQPGPVWSLLYWPIAAATAFSLAVSALSLLQPARLRLIAAGRVVGAAAAALIIVMLIRGELLTPTEAALAEPGGPRLQAVLYWLTASFKLALAVAAAIWIFEAGSAVMRARRGISA
jgi:hypothetical protein